MPPKSFIVDCSGCKAKVAVEVAGVVQSNGTDPDTGEPFGERLYVGKCPRCFTHLAGESRQIHFAGYDTDYSQWSDVVRVFPIPFRTFSSRRIPRVVTESLSEANLAMQVGAQTAACVMFGRALEAICRNILEAEASKSAPTPSSTTQTTSKKKIMLAEGIQKLKDGGYIDARIYDWSKHLNAFRNLAAHPDEEISISRQDAEDLQTFVYAIVEYIYDLTDRYNEFLERMRNREKEKMNEEEKE